MLALWHVVLLFSYLHLSLSARISCYNSPGLCSRSYLNATQPSNSTLSSNATQSSTAIPNSNVTKSCNGSPALCGRSYSNVTEIGAHDSAFVGSSLTDNQDVSITAQLNAGIRFLQAQTHKDTQGILSLCHTSCFLLDAGPLVTYLSTVKTWLDANPNEVLTILLTNGDRLSPTDFDTAFKASGLVPSIYYPDPNLAHTLDLSQWPTLQTLITANTRLVVFLDYGANTAVVPYLLDEFTYYFETPYDTTDPAFAQCALDRPPGASPDGRMYIMNHFLDSKFLGVLVPNTNAIATTNAATGPGSIGAQMSLCAGLYGRRPKAILVDNFDKGQVFIAQDAANNL